MATYSQVANYDSSLSAFLQTGYALNHALNLFGWKRNTDVGQAAYPGTFIKTISAVSGNGTVVTVTYDDTIRWGNPLSIGAQVQLNGVTTTTAYNGTYVITGISGQGTTSATYTFASATTGTAVVTGASSQTNNYISITNASGNGTNATFTYNDTTRFGSPILPGMSITVAGCTTGGFNTTMVVQSITGQGTSSATFTAANSTNVTEAESGATGSVPTNNSTTGAAEIWVPNDGLTAFYLKVQVTQPSGTNPGLQMFIGQGTNGAGTLTGSSISSTPVNNSTGTFVNTHFLSGDSGSFRGMMWTVAANNSCPNVFNIERSLNNSGAYTSDHVTLCYGVGIQAPWSQQTLFLSGGATIQETGGLSVILPKTATTGNLGNNTLVSPVFALVGYVDNPMIGLLIARGADFGSGVQVQATLYNTLHTYLTTLFASGLQQNTSISSTGASSLAMIRYE